MIDLPLDFIFSQNFTIATYHNLFEKKNIYYKVKENRLHENTNVKISKIIMWISVHLLCMSCYVELRIRTFSSFTSTNL
jgi:hypothetical protein